MKKVLITGATGLIGRSLITFFQQEKKYEVYVVTTNKKKLLGYENINIVEGDLKDSYFRKQIIESVTPEVLVQLAWDQTRPDIRQSNENLRWLDISIDLLYSFIESRGKRFIFAGSSSEYDAEKGTFRENSLAKATSKYGQCKRCFTELAQCYCKDQCSFVSLRYFTVFGENDTHSFGAIPEAVRKLKNDEEVVCNSPFTTRDYIYAQDAAEITYKMIESSFEGILNVASGKAYTMAEVFRIIGEALGKEGLVKINWTNKEKNEFNADITLLESLNLIGTTMSFEERIASIIEKY